MVDTLITSIDDFSRKLLFVEFFPHETTWAHIQAAQALTQEYGLPLRYYVDSLRGMVTGKNKAFPVLTCGQSSFGETRGAG